MFWWVTLLAWQPWHEREPGSEPVSPLVEWNLTLASSIAMDVLDKEVKERRQRVRLLLKARRAQGDWV